MEEVNGNFVAAVALRTINPANEECPPTTVVNSTGAEVVAGACKFAVERV